MTSRVRVVGIERGHWRGGRDGPLPGLWAALRPWSFTWRVVGATGAFRQRCGQLGAALGKSWESKDWSSRKEGEAFKLVFLHFVLYLTPLYSPT